MVKESQESLSKDKIKNLLAILEEYGKQEWLKSWKEHMAIPNDDYFLYDSEKVLRYLLLRVLINQQAKVYTVRRLSLELYYEFGEALLFKPYLISELEILSIFKKICGDRGKELYSVGFLGGIKPISLFAYRFKAYEGFIRWLESKNLSLSDFIIYELQNNKPSGLLSRLKEDEILDIGWVGNDPKACRMYVNWVLFLINDIWKIAVIDQKESFMIVDGHVGKIFCRAGLLGEVLYEKKRPYIIEASKLRDEIEKIVISNGNIPFYVDNGAFYIYQNGYCLDISPKCEECLLSLMCKKYIKWTAYQQFNKDK